MASFPRCRMYPDCVPEEYPCPECKPSKGKIMPELIAVHPDGKIEKKEITKVPELQDLKDIVNGWIEMVPYFITYEGNPCIAFCNEEGKLPHLDLPFNAAATKLWAKSVIGSTGQTRINDHLVGSIAIVVGPKNFLKDM